MEFYLNLPAGVRGYSFHLGTIDLCDLCREPARNCDHTLTLQVIQNEIVEKTIICEDCLNAIGRNYELLKRASS